MSSAFTPTAWFNSAHIVRWLDDVFPSWRTDNVRWDIDAEGRWYWIIPDFDRGRSRIIGIDTGLLEVVTLRRLQELLEAVNWSARINDESLLVKRDEDGAFYVDAWNPELRESWRVTRAGEHFVVFPTETSGVGVGYIPALPEPFLEMRAASWSAIGPKGNPDPRTYTDEELTAYVPHVGVAG